MKQPSDEQEERDKLCAYRDPETGKQCGGFHTKTSALCNIHSGGLTKMQEARRRNTELSKELADSINFDLEQLDSLADVKAALAKLFNAVKIGAVGKDKAQSLVLILQQMQRVLEKQSGGPRTGGLLSIQVGSAEALRITASFATTKELDEFLLAGEAASVRLIEDLQAKGNVHVGAIDVEATEVEAPLGLDLFGLPQLHQWKPENRPDLLGGVSIMSRVYVCQICKQESPSKNKEECNEPA